MGRLRRLAAIARGAGLGGDDPWIAGRWHSRPDLRLQHGRLPRAWVTVAEAAGKPLEEYADDVLFRPLGITPGDWMRSPQDEVSAGSGLEMTARDMLKLGHLYLRNGEWDGEQIVDPEYAAAATTWQSAGDSTGAWAGYGYQWWITATNAGYPAYFALGYGGQHIFVVPALDLVVVAAIARRVNRDELRTPRYLIESIAAAASRLSY